MNKYLKIIKDNNINFKTDKNDIIELFCNIVDNNVVFSKSTNDFYTSEYDYIKTDDVTNIMLNYLSILLSNNNSIDNMCNMCLSLVNLYDTKDFSYYTPEDYKYVFQLLNNITLYRKTDLIGIITSEILDNPVKKYNSNNIIIEFSEIELYKVKRMTFSELQKYIKFNYRDLLIETAKSTILKNLKTSMSIFDTLLSF